MARGDGALRLRQARRALRARARRPRRGVRGHRVPCVPGRRGQGLRAARPGRPRSRRRSTASRTGPSSSAPAASCGCGCATHGALESPVAKFLCEGEQIGLVDALGAARGDLVLDLRRRPAPRATTCSARCASSSAARRCTRAACTSCGSSTSRCSKALDDDGRPIPGAPPVHDAAPRRPRDPRARHARGSARACARWPTTSCSTGGSWARAACGSTAPTCSSRIFSLLGITDEEAQARFGFLLDAFRYGAPPHAGLRVRHRPAGRDPLRRGQHPRGDRVPEDAVGRRPAHRRARGHRPGPAQRARPPHASAISFRRRNVASPSGSEGERVWATLAEGARCMRPTAAAPSPDCQLQRTS